MSAQLGRLTSLPGDEVMNLLNESVDAHFKSIRGLAFGFEYLTVLNPDYFTSLVKEFLIYAPSAPPQQGGAVSPGKMIPGLFKTLGDTLWQTKGSPFHP